MANCINKSLPEFKILVQKTGMNKHILAAKIAIWQDKNNTLGVFPTIEQIIGDNSTKLTNVSNQERLYQKGYINDNLKETEFGIRDLAARLANRIGGEVEFISDLTKDFSGYNEGSKYVINLAKATLDTPIHEIVGHPIIRAIKDNKTIKDNYKELLDSVDNIEGDFTTYEKINGKWYSVFNGINGRELTKEDPNSDSFKTVVRNAKSLKDKFKKREESELYQNLLKELETGYGKEVLDRIKKEYVYKEISTSLQNELNDEDDFDFDIAKELETKTLNGKKYIHRIQDNIGRWYEQVPMSLEEQQEEALVQLLGELTAGKIKETKENKNLISLLKRLLKEMTAYMRSLFNSKEIEIDKLSADMTLNDLANLLAYTNSKIILPGSRVEYTTPDNSKFSTYQEASNHISKLFKESKDVDLSDVGLDLRKKVNNSIEIPVSKFTDEFTNDVFIKKDNSWYYENTDKKVDDALIIHTWNNNISDNVIGKSGVEGFIEKNKPFEQSKEIIEIWKKENNIKYNPEEVYSRGQGFYSSIGAYSTIELDLLLQNLLHHIEDNKKASGKFAISAFTKPVGKRIKHLEGESSVRFKIYPKSEDILWAAPTDVFSGSVWDASEKVSKNKKSELLGVSHTKAPSLNNINEVSPNLADIIDKRSHDHNELGIELTHTNFRLEYDETVPYEIKKLVNSINSILDSKYGKIVKPEIKQKGEKIIQYGIFSEGANDILDWFDTKEEAQAKVDESNQQLIDLGLNPDFSVKPITKPIGIQPTKTKENTTSIESVKDKVLRNTDKYVLQQHGDKFVIYDIEEQEPLDIFENKENALKEIKKLTGQESLKEKEYTSQALTNTKIAMLKEIAKKYPRSLITSKVVNNQSSERQYQKNKRTKDVFNQKEFKNQVNYSLKTVDILSSDKAKQVFAKGEKNGWSLNKILTELQIPKEQKQIILDKNIKNPNILNSKEELDKIANSNSRLSKVAKLIANKISSATNRIVYADFNIIDKSNAAGVAYSSLEDGILKTDVGLNKSTIEQVIKYRKDLSDFKEETIVHEEIHRFTQLLFQIDRVKGDKTLKEIGFSKAEIDFVEEVKSLYSQYKATNNTNNDFNQPNTSIEEFITYGLTNGEFIKHISKIKVKNTTVLEKLISILTKLFGNDISIKQALDKSFEDFMLADTILEEISEQSDFLKPDNFNLREEIITSLLNDVNKFKNLKDNRSTLEKELKFNFKSFKDETEENKNIEGLRLKIDHFEVIKNEDGYFYNNGNEITDETIINKFEIRKELREGKLRIGEYNNNNYFVLSNGKILGSGKTNLGKETISDPKIKEEILKNAIKYKNC
jgi:hypothetical protein